MLPKYGHRTPQNLSAFFRLARGARKWHEIQGCDLWDNFPKEVSQGWAISETVTYSHCYIHASAALLIFSFSKLPVTTFQCSFSTFPFHILWVMHAFIPPNNSVHHPIRAGELFISCPYGGKTERWERERKKGNWVNKEREKWKEGPQGNRVNKMTLLFH